MAGKSLYVVSLDITSSLVNYTYVFLAVGTFAACA